MQALKRLSQEQVDQYKENGFIKGIPIFNSEEVRDLSAGFDRLCTLLRPGETPYVMDGWERYNTWLYELVMDPRILDCVEDLLGPNFYQWGSNMLCKMPREGLYIPWHQDLYDWPLWPPEVLTVWIAFDDVDEENGCLKFLPGTHENGIAQHLNSRPSPRGTNKSLLPFYLDPNAIDDSRAVPTVM
jgi:non-heme Fe2+,alpha-ketoglutarate-dependent halogenase